MVLYNKAASTEMLRNACYCTVAWAPPSLKTALTALTAGVSGRAAAARIIAADFSAVPTDSPLQTAVAQQLATATQRFKEMLLC